LLGKLYDFLLGFVLEVDFYVNGVVLGEFDVSQKRGLLVKSEVEVALFEVHFDVTFEFFAVKGAEGLADWIFSGFSVACWNTRMST
jgi:hypothetical protein